MLADLSRSSAVRADTSDRRRQPGGSGGEHDRDRVVGSTGKLVGYGGGLELKKRLLRLEGALL